MEQQQVSGGLGTPMDLAPPCIRETYCKASGRYWTAVKRTAFMPCGTAVQVADSGLAPPAVSHILNITAYLRSINHMSRLARTWTRDGMVDSPSLLQMPGLYPGPEPLLPFLVPVPCMKRPL